MAPRTVKHGENHSRPTQIKKNRVPHLFTALTACKNKFTTSVAQNKTFILDWTAHESVALLAQDAATGARDPRRKRTAAAPLEPNFAVSGAATKNLHMAALCGWIIYLSPRQFPPIPTWLPVKEPLMLCVYHLLPQCWWLVAPLWCIINAAARHNTARDAYNARLYKMSAQKAALDSTSASDPAFCLQPLRCFITHNSATCRIR